jgi:FkbM family methyltransferase
MRKLKDILAEYKQGNLTKMEYIEKMHQKHQALFEYASFLGETNINKIEIIDSTVIMTTRDREIKLLCDKDDMRIIPIEILNFGDYEQECMDMMMRLIKPSFNIFDVGANIGWYSMNFAKCISGVKLFAFEPMAKTFNYLTRNIELNEISSIEKYNFGFSNEEKELTFYYDFEGSGNSSMANLSEKKHIQEITCKVTTLDKFTQRENIAVDFIKCDVEGAELFVFTGGEATLRQHKPIIFTEMLRKWSAKFNYHPNEIIEFLQTLGYRCFIIKENRLEEFHSMNDQTVETNFIFLHNEKHQEIIHSFNI